MVSLSSGEFQSRVTNSSGKMRPPPYPTNIMFYVFWFLIIFIGWHYFMIAGCGRGGGNSGGSIQEKQLVIWVKHSQHADPVKVYVSYNADIADVKKVVRQELQPALDKESLGRVLLLSPELGRLSPPTLIRKVDLGKNDNLIVFVDNLESRLFLKTLTTDRLPLQVNAPLCLKTDEAYIVVAKILMGSYSQQDITALKNSLCESSIESWSSRYSYAGR